MAVGKDWDNLLQKYKNRLETEFGDGEFDESKPILTKNYADFKKESMTAKLSYYEKMCNWSEKILNLKHLTHDNVKRITSRFTASYNRSR